MGAPPFANPMMGGMPPGQPPGVPGMPSSVSGLPPGTGFPVGQPGFIAPPPDQPPPGVDPELTPPVGNVYAIDPEVLDRPVRIKIDGSSRMLSRSALQQIWPMLSQSLLSGPLLAEMTRNGITVDFIEFLRMLEDAVGTMRSYRLVRPMNQAEQQARNSLPPEVQARTAAQDKSDQIRLQLGQMKLDGDKNKVMTEAEWRQKGIDEESARHILALIAQEKADKANKPNPAIEQAQMQAKLQGDAASKQLDLQSTAASKQLKLQHAQAMNNIELQKAAHDLVLQHVGANQDQMADLTHTRQQLLLNHLTGQQKLQHAQESHQQNLRQLNEQGKQQLALKKASARLGGNSSKAQ